MSTAGAEIVNPVPADANVLFAMGATALAIDGDADNQNFQAGKGQHQPGAEGSEIEGDEQQAAGKYQKQPLGLPPAQASVGFDGIDSLGTATADFHIRPDHMISLTGVTNGYCCMSFNGLSATVSECVRGRNN